MKTTKAYVTIIDVSTIELAKNWQATYFEMLQDTLAGETSTSVASSSIKFFTDSLRLILEGDAHAIILLFRDDFAQFLLSPAVFTEYEVADMVNIRVSVYPNKEVSFTIYDTQLN